MEILPKMITFTGKPNRTIKDLTVPDNLCIVTQEKAWINKRLTMVWYEKIWLRYVRERKKEKGFPKSLRIMDAFKAHFKDEVPAMLVGHAGVVSLCRMYI